MKPTRSSFKILLILVAVILHTVCLAQNFSRSRSLSKSFAVYKETELQVFNKYGNINLIPWEKDSVRFEIHVNVVSNKQVKADKTFDIIDFDFKATRYYLIAKTVFAGQNDFLSDVGDLAAGIFGSGTNTNISYSIYYPNSIRLTIENKYGNIFCTNHTGRIDLKLSNGDLKAYSFTGEASIKIDNGKAEINDIDKAKLTLNYGEIRLGKANALTIDSKSSSINIDEINELHLISKRDKIKITKVMSCNGQLNYSQSSFGTLTDDLEFTMNYGTMDLAYLSKNLKSIRLDCRYSDISILLNKNSSYSTNLQYTEASEVLVPSQIINKKITDVSIDKKIKKLECVLGDTKKPVTDLDFTITAGKLDIKF